MVTVIYSIKVVSCYFASCSYDDLKICFSSDILPKFVQFYNTSVRLLLRKIFDVNLIIARTDVFVIDPPICWKTAYLP